MKCSPRSVRSLVLSLLSFWVLVRVAQSYLEPGGTSFLLKILISFLAGAIVVFRQFRGGIRLLFSKLFSRRPKQTVSPGQSQAKTSKRKSGQEQSQQVDEDHGVAKEPSSTTVMEESRD
jgi:hypothetical protein